MTLHRQSNWFMTAAAAAVMLCLGLTLYASALVRAASTQALQAELAARGAGQLSYLAMETALYRQPRTTAQWRVRTDSFAVLLDRLHPDVPAARALLARQADNLATISRLHARLAASSTAPLVDRTSASDASASMSATISALFLVAQAMEDDAFALARMSRDAQHSAQLRLSVLVLVNVLLLGCLIAAGAIAIRRRVLVPIATLQGLIEAVSAGHLDARADLPLGNELGVLAAAFNHMTGRLEEAQKQARREIAHRQSAQQALEESMLALARTRADVQAIVDHMPALVVYWDADLVNRFANRASWDWLGMAPEAILGMRMPELVGRRRFASHEPRIRDVLAGRPALFETLVDLADGRSRHALFSYIPDQQDGVVKGFYGVVSDITALRRAEAAQEEALAQLRSVIDAADDFAIILTDTDGVIRLFSAGAERMLGYRAAELVARSTPALLHDPAELARCQGAPGSAGPAAYDPVIGPVRSGGSDTREWTFLRQDGGAVTVSLTMSAVRDDAGHVIGFLGMAKDIGPEKQRQHELIDARDAAQAASTTKSMFLANMSHEIRTPMNAVIGMLELLGYTELNTLQRDYVGKTSGAARSLLALLNDILDLSRIEADGLTLETADFELTSLTADLSSMLGALVGDKDLELLFTIAPSLPRTVRGDALRLRQVLINLASNAIKFTERGEVRLAISHDEQELITFSVSDTGIGISSSKLERIFDQFSQAEESTTRRFGGTGLGLAISQRLVALMGGQLQVDSVLGQGSRFRFTLALPSSGDKATALPAPVPQALAGALRVLIVDDNASARQVLASIVQALGWYPDCAADGPSALDLLATAPPYAVVMVDWRMPGMDGFELTSRIAARAAHIGAALPVIIMVTASARADLTDQLQRARPQPHGILVKPVTAPMLVNAIRVALAPPGSPSPPVPADGSAPLGLADATALAGLHLLLVDDNRLNQLVAYELLSRRGAMVTVADGGTMAVSLALAADARFDAVLMDIQMPDMDGYQACRAIRAGLGGSALPILAMTANAMQGDRELSLAAGMNDHLSKPIDIALVVHAILRHCGRPDAGVPAPSQQVPPDSPAMAIQFDQALDRLGGDKAIYFSLSGIFAAESAALLDELEDAFAAQAWLRAADRLHTYKSAAGMLGAEQLQHDIGALEQRLRTAPTGLDCAAALSAIRADTDTITDELGLIEQANRQAPRTRPPAVTQAGLTSCLDQLDILLAQSSMRALSQFDDLQDNYGPLLGERLRPLAAAIATLDFNSALACSDSLRKETAS